MTTSPAYTFKVDLAVVESLGINLYSNAAAVLSELVANAWDADANAVEIDWDTSGGTIRIEDDGVGMSYEELNERFLTVAYKKRDREGHQSPKFNRPFMGRKGIGKLSVFSLARTVKVYSRKEGESGVGSGFEIDVTDLRRKIAESKTYHPEPIPIPTDLPPHGTRLVLSNLNKKRSGVSIAALRRRIARRFDVLTFSDTDDDRFKIVINGQPVAYEDREDLKRLEYIWHLGVQEIPTDRTPNVKKSWVIADNYVDPDRGWKIEGWFGTVTKPDQLIDSADTQESLRNIMILARKRPIQEGILDQLDFNKLFANYVTGQIRAEFLDLDDGSDDISTSDRQRLIEDDERVSLLISRLRELFNQAERQWSVERPKQKFNDLTDDYPAVREWALGRPMAQRDAAVKMVSTVAALSLDEEKERKPLFRASILAFERIAIEQSTTELAKFADGLFAVDVLPMLAGAKAYEDALYLQILRSRLEAIEKLEGMINKDELEKVLQAHLYNNMWLLDPSWEGATGDVDMEVSLSRVRKRSKLLFDKSETENQKQGRIDIQYRTAAGVHMIVELKKYGRKTTLDELRLQGSKYHEALTEVLHKQGQKSRHITVVFVLGQEPDVGYVGSATVAEAIDVGLSFIDGRVLYYDQLLHTAQRAYKEYRERSKDVTELDKVLATLDAEPQAPQAPVSGGQ